MIKKVNIYFIYNNTNNNNNKSSWAQTLEQPSTNPRGSCWIPSSSRLHAKLSLNLGQPTVALSSTGEVKIPRGSIKYFIIIVIYVASPVDLVDNGTFTETINHIPCILCFQAN